MKLNQNSVDPQKLREFYIRSLSDSSNPTQKARELADNLFALDLTVYSNDYTLDSIIYSAFAKSQLDDEVSLHPEQIEIIEKIKENDALIVSAPTSFGKTFCVFEYIARTMPNNIVLIVPTLALIEEYIKKIIKKYHRLFSKYKIHTHIDEEKNMILSKKIYLLSHTTELFKKAHIK